MEEEFLLLQSIKTDKDRDAKTYRIDILLYHLLMKKIAGISNIKLENLLKLAKVVFSTVHSNAEEESLLS